MTDINILSGTLIASAEERTVSGLLVPYGEEGRTNLGKFTVHAGALTLPRDPQSVTLNLDHDREQPIARATVLAEEADGIHATFRFFDTEEGDLALEEFRSGTRQKLSVEAKNMVLRAGKAISGRIFGAAQLAVGAFPSATLMAADVGELPEPIVEPEPTILTPDESGDIAVTVTTTPETVTVTDADSTTTTFTNPEKEAEMPIPNTLEASGAPTTEKRPLSLYEVGVLYAQRSTKQISDLEFATALEGQNGATLFAALSDVKYNGVGGLAVAMSPTPQWLGQVWQATTYRQQVLPLFNHGDLNALTFSGFKWTTKPSGGDWAGNKVDIASNTIVAAPISGTAVRYAIGHDIAREFVDFPVEGFFESYAAAVTEDHARWADAKVAVAALAGATVLVGDALTTLPGPSGGTIGSAASAIIDGATAIITAGSLPDFALVAPALWKQMAKMPKSNVIGYLNASLGLEEGSLEGFVIRPSASVTAGKVLVGCKSAVTVLELPGSPIRIDALDLARGGIDKAAFGYLGINVNDALGLQLVTAATV